MENIKFNTDVRACPNFESQERRSTETSAGHQANTFSFCPIFKIHRNLFKVLVNPPNRKFQGNAFSVFSCGLTDK